MVLAAGVAASLAACSAHGLAVRQDGSARNALPAPRFSAALVGETPPAASGGRGITVRITNLGSQPATPTCALRAVDTGTGSEWSTSMSAPPIPAGGSVVIRGGTIMQAGGRLADLEVACV
jgi:hypothetical protein